MTKIEFVKNFHALRLKAFFSCKDSLPLQNLFTQVMKIKLTSCRGVRS